MGIFGGIRPSAMTSRELSEILTKYFVNPTSSGVSVNPDSAMRLMTVQNCIRVRAFTISQLPLFVMERKGDTRSKAEDFYLYELLHDQPNKWMTSSEFWAMAEAYVCSRGNFFAYKSRGTNGRIRSLLPLSDGMVDEVKQNPDWSLTYKVRFNNGDVQELKQGDIFHLRGLTMNGYLGINPVEYARECIGLGMAAERFLGNYFGNGMHPGAVIEHPQALSAKSYASLRENLKQKYQGLGKSHEFMLIDEGMTIRFPEIKLVDAQFLEQMKMTEAQICGLFRVPLMLIQSGDKAPTYASAEQFMLSYSIYGVTPDVVNYEKAIRRDLLNEEEREKYYAKFEVRALLRSSFNEQMESFATAIDKEILNPNECRSLLDMNPYPGGEEYRTRTSTVKDGGKTNEP